MSRAGRWGTGVAALAVAGALVAVPAARATGQAPEPGQWAAPGVRIEPLDPAGTVSVDGAEYRGRVDVVAATGGVSAVNEVAFEDYVQGIAEVPPSWPLEALKAQAVAARTYALESMSGTVATAFRDAGAHICATQSCQVYVGTKAERRVGGERWVEAVRATAGQVLLHGGRPIRAKYSSSNGGHSVAGGAPYLPAAPDPHDAAVSPYARWTSSASLAELAAIFPADGQLVAVWSAETVVVLGRHLADGTVHHQAIPKWDFRSALNGALPPPPGLPRRVPAPMFDARMATAETVALDGRGYGHGVGMSQYGAMGKARSGWNHAQILAAYYGGTVPILPPPEQLPSTIRVAVATGRGSVAVSSPGPFRVVTTDGAVLAHAATGEWRVAPGPGGVEVVAPDPERGAAAVEVRAIEAPHPPGAPAAVTFAVSAPVFVQVVLEGAAGGEPAPPPVALGLRWPGEHRVELPAAPVPGQVLVVHADRGGGRVASASASFDRPTGEPAVRTAAVAEPVAPPDGEASRAGAALVAALLAAAVGSVSGRTLGRLR